MHSVARISHFLAVALFLASAASADPRTDYMLHCQGCHGPDGSGAAGAVPSFRDQVATFLLVPRGREYLIRVPGVSQSELDDERTAAVLNWIVDEFDAAGRPVDAVPFTAAEVARYRKPPLVDVDVIRGELLRAIENR